MRFWLILLLFIGQIGLSQTNELNNIVMLSKSGVTNTIIKAYIDGLTNKISLNATNIISLKNQQVSDEIVLYILNKKQSVTNIVTNTVNKYVIVEPDIESYSFFKQYYLIPRARMYQYELTNKFRR